MTTPPTTRATPTISWRLGIWESTTIPAIDDLEAIIDQFLPYGRTTTSIMQSAPIPRRPLPLG